MFIRSLAVSAVAVVVSMSAFAQSDVIASSQFVALATSSGQFMVEASRLALERSQKGPLAEFAQHMIEDHTKAAEHLAAAASAEGMTPPAEMTEAHRAKLEALDATDRRVFEAAYVTAQAAAHQEAVALFTAFVATGQVNALTAFAQETLLVLREHERGISELAAR